MAKHSVNVLVKARDEASKRFAIIGASAKLMGKAFTSVGNMAKNVLAVGFRMVKRAAIGLAAALGISTYAAIKQQAAEVELASALKITGQYTEETLQKLKEEATAIQDATVYGDEYVLSLERMALTLGVTADKAGDAAKAAIALFEGFGGGRGKPAIFLRYYIDALRGTGSSLESYVGELRKAKTPQERQLILLNALARGWDVAKSKTESAGGALKQMKNKLGDIAEAIAWPLLPAITSTAHAVTRWAKENEANIAYWAAKTFDYVTFVKDAFMSFVDFMREDWKAGMKFAFDSFLTLLKAAFQTAVTTAIIAGKGIWKGIREGLLGGKERDIEELIKELYLADEVEKARKAGGIPPPEAAFGPVKGGPIYEEYRAKAEAEYVKRRTESVIGGGMRAITETWKDALKEIAETAPPDLKKTVGEAFDELQKRLKKLGEPPGRKPIGAEGEAGAPEPFSMIADKIKDAISKKVGQWQAREAGFLTFAPGTKFNYYEEQMLVFTRKQLQTLNDMAGLLNAQRKILERRDIRGAETEIAVTDFR